MIPHLVPPCWPASGFHRLLLLPPSLLFLINIHGIPNQHCLAEGIITIIIIPEQLQQQQLLSRLLFDARHGVGRGAAPQKRAEAFEP